MNTRISVALAALALAATLWAQPAPHPIVITPGSAPAATTAPAPATQPVVIKPFVHPKIDRGSVPTAAECVSCHGAAGVGPRAASTRPGPGPAAAGLWEQIVNAPYYKDLPLLKAQKLLFHGQYADAEKLFDQVLAGKVEDKDKATATIGRLEAIFRQGKQSDLKRFQEALATVPAALKDDAKLVKVQAEALVEAGDLPGAAALLKTWIGKHEALTPLAAPALAVRNLYGDILETQANYVVAKSVYKAVADLAENIPADNAAVITEIASAIDRLAVLSEEGRLKHQTVLAMLTKAIESDGTYWPAHLVAAQILLAAHNGKDGGAEIAALHDLNPSDLQSYLLAVAAPMESYDFDKAHEALDELKKHTESADVQALEGRLFLKERVPDLAIPPLLEAVKRKPFMPEARGWLAAAYFLTAQPAKAEEQIAAVKTPDGTPHPVVLFEAAEILRDARQFPQAEKFYRDCSDAAPWWSEPYAALAMLYMETGQRDEARQAHERANKIDPYNIRDVNQLTLLDIMDQWAKPVETQHFIVYYDTEDALLAQLISEWLEKVYPEVCGDFQAEPTFKTQIELFPSHEEFGVRTTGLPWIGTVGACTGHVIAMDVPRGGTKDLVGAFDWARVVRHEFTHAVTLSMTHNRIPHWLTEAAAVSEEQAPRDWANCELLANRYRTGTLFKLQDLNWGFIHPKGSTDRQAAYMQSQWIWEYLVEKYGHDKMIAFIKCFAADMTEGQAMQATYGKSMEELDHDFLVWAHGQVEAWGLPAEPLPNLAAAQQAAKDDPNNLKVKLALAEVMLTQRGGAAPAKKLLDEIVTADPKAFRARELQGALAFSAKKNDEAQKTLEALLKDDPKRPVAVRILGLMAMAKGKDSFDDAEKWFLQLETLRPLEQTSYENLAGIYLSRNQPDKAIAQLKELQAHEQKDERIPRKLADLLRAAGDLREAESMAFKAVRINPYNAVNHQLLAQVLDAEKQPARAVEYWQITTTLQPKIAAYWTGLADDLGATGKLDAASEAAKKAVELQPKSPAAKWIKN